MAVDINKVLEQMIDYSEGNLHDIAHLVKVHSFAEQIGKLEHIPDDTQEILELAAIVHDIACPLCREKYGNTNGKYQEKEGGPLAREFLTGCGVPSDEVERVAYLVEHHHTYSPVDGLDYQILLEADFLVNADGSHLGRESIEKMRDKVYRTDTGIRLLESMYLK